MVVDGAVVEVAAVVVVDALVAVVEVELVTAVVVGDVAVDCEATSIFWIVDELGRLTVAPSGTNATVTSPLAEK